MAEQNLQHLLDQGWDEARNAVGDGLAAAAGAFVVVAALSAGLRAIRAVRAVQQREPLHDATFDDDTVITIDAW